MKTVSRCCLVSIQLLSRWRYKRKKKTRHQSSNSIVSAFLSVPSSVQSPLNALALDESFAVLQVRLEPGSPPHLIAHHDGKIKDLSQQRIMSVNYTSSLSILSRGKGGLRGHCTNGLLTSKETRRSANTGQVNATEEMSVRFTGFIKKRWAELPVRWKCQKVLWFGLQGPPKTVAKRLQMHWFYTFTNWLTVFGWSKSQVKKLVT